VTGIETFKITQESLDQTQVEIVKGMDFMSSSEELIVDAFKQRLGDSVEIKISYVNAINSEKSGKFRYVESKI